MIVTVMGGIATALMTLVTAGPATAPQPCKPIAKDPRASVKVHSATVRPGGRDLAVKVTYVCRKGTSLAVVAAQPPGSGAKATRIGAGSAKPVCDGAPHTTTVTAKPGKPFEGTWRRGTRATVGANVLLVIDRCSYPMARHVISSATLK
ncbi:hypothetical protein [Actinomadura hibisca]|uniref:hypothetical protein n=1 Tax=Actinomadura hibisca TaxID=68565 RepID=UPI00082D5E57|nr:hypothetical protein [Actinomadura hibisca]